MEFLFVVEEVREQLEETSAGRARVRHTMLRPLGTNVAGQIEVIEKNPSTKGFVVGSEIEVEISARETSRKGAKKT